MASAVISRAWGEAASALRPVLRADGREVVLRNVAVELVEELDQRFG